MKRLIGFIFVTILIVTNTYAGYEQGGYFQVDNDSGFGDSGNVIGQPSSINNEIVLFSGTTGKIIKRATSTGILTGTSGVIGSFSTSAGLASALSDETGTGLSVFNTAPVFIGNVGINTGTQTVATELQVASTSTSSPRGIMSSQHNDGTDGARFHGRKSRGTITAPSTIVSGDNLARWVASGYDGSNYLEMCGIIMGSEGTIATTRVPTNIQMYTATNDTPSILTERLRIDSAGLANFRNGNTQISSTYAADRVINGDMGTSTGWTVGANWSISGGVATHTSGSTATLSRSDIVGVVGQQEKITFTIGGTPASTVTIGIGGQVSAPFSTTGTKTVYLTSTTTGALTITPATGFTGTIDDVAVQAQTNGKLTVDGGIIIQNGQVLAGGLNTTENSTFPKYSFQGDTNTGIDNNMLDTILFYAGGIKTVSINSAGIVTIQDLRFGSSQDLVVTRNSANFLEMRNSTNNQTFGIDETYTDASNYSRLKILSDSSGYNFKADQLGSGIAARPFIFQTSGTSTSNGFIIKDSAGTAKFTMTDAGAITTGGAITSGGSITAGGGNSLIANIITSAGAGTTLTMNNNSSSAANLIVVSLASGTQSQTSGNTTIVRINPTYNQTSGTAANTDLLINRTETAIGTGEQKLASFQVGSVVRWEVDNLGIENVASLDGVNVVPTQSCKVLRHSKSVSDDGTVTLKMVTTTGHGRITCGDMTEYTEFWVNSTGTVTLVGASANVVANADTDTKLCIGTAAAQEPLQIKNRLGGTNTVNIVFEYD